MPISRPNITLNIIPAAQTIQNQPQRVLFVGQKTSAGTATSGALIQDIGNAGQENILFGEKSMLAAMVRAAKKINQVSRFDAIALSDNGSAVKATGTIAFSGTATEAQTIYVAIGSYKNNRYELNIANGMTATQAGDALIALISADTKSLVTAANSTGTVTLTAINGGTEGNSLGIKIDGTVAGISVTLTAFASGATNPTLTGLFDVIANQRYQTIVYPSSYTLSILLDMLAARWNPDNKVLDGVGVICKIDTLSNLKSLGNTYNDLNLAIIGDYKVNAAACKGGAVFEVDNVIAAQVAAVRALRLTVDANLSRYVIATNGARDSFGGPALASLPYFNTPFYDLQITSPEYEFSEIEQTELNSAGISVIGNNQSNSLIILGDVVTTYKTDIGGNPNKSYKYLNYVDTISNSREYQFNNFKSRFGQCRLTTGDLIPGRNMANENLIKAFAIQLYTDLSGEDFVLTQAGEDALEFFKQNLKVTIEMENGLVRIYQLLPINTQLRSIIGSIQLAFSTEG